MHSCRAPSLRKGVDQVGSLMKTSWLIPPSAVAFDLPPLGGRQLERGAKYSFGQSRAISNRASLMKRTVSLSVGYAYWEPPTNQNWTCG